jgi:transglutaminase-like putative cysteine protease
MRLSVHYTTSYLYGEAADGVIQLLRLTPLSCSSQTVLDWRVDVDRDAKLRQGWDGYGNVTHMLYLDEQVDAFSISVTGRVLTEDRAGIVQGVPGDLPPAVFLRPTELTQPDAALCELAAALRQQGGTDLEKLHCLTRAIHMRMAFEPGKTRAGTTAAEAFGTRAGVCQDYAHIFLAVARTLGVPARYVSGHLFRRDDRVRQDAAHAWAEAWVEDLGWVAFDPANGICADDAYIRVAAGLDYRDAAPFAGTRRGGSSEELSVDVQVREVGARSQRQRQSQSMGPNGMFQSQG